MMIRAKMRLLSVTKHLDGTVTHVMKAVKRTGKDGKNLDPENTEFWKYTPAGDASFTYLAGRAPDTELGSYHYVDFTVDEAGGFAIDTLNLGSRGAYLTVEVSRYSHYGRQDSDSGKDLRHASIKLSLSSESETARRFFETNVHKMLDVRLTLAEPHDGTP